MTIGYQTAASLSGDLITVAWFANLSDWFRAKRRLQLYEIECRMDAQTDKDSIGLRVPQTSVGKAREVLYPQRSLQPVSVIPIGAGGFPMDDPRPPPPTLQAVEIRPAAPVGPAAGG